MLKLRGLIVALALLALPSPTHAGLYYSAEEIADLPAQWRGFLLDHRQLRLIAAKPAAGTPASPLRVRYEQEAAKLEAAAKLRRPTADEQADLGALYLRLGEVGKALDLLRNAQREYPHHFRSVANLGTAWQLQGDLVQAAASLQEAVRLAPGKFQKAEELQLRLVRLRQRQARDAQELDDLFGIRYAGEVGKYEPGKLAAAERKKLQAEAIAHAQLLALWLPADGKLLWQLAELANATGDVKTAAAIMDGCVTEFGLHDLELRQHRQLVRTAADALVSSPDDKDATHEGHASLFRPRSRRPLASKLWINPLPAVSETGVNLIPWSVVNETTVDRDFKPTFPKYLRELNGKQVALTGFMQPIGEDPDMSSFMLIEYPVGCWYCEMPEVTGLVFVELPRDKTVRFARALVRIQGKLTLNTSDPENFLYTVSQARVTEPD